MRTLCEGTGQRGVGHLYPHCPVCGREFSAQGGKARARIGNAWKRVPRHFRVKGGAS